jgi:hypothetical protein
VFGTSIAIQSPEALKIVQIILSVTLCIGQHAQKPRGRFPYEFAVLIETPHGIPASFVFTQDFRHELALGGIRMMPLYVLTGDIHPKLQSLVHSVFHC